MKFWVTHQFPQSMQKYLMRFFIYRSGKIYPPYTYAYKMSCRKDMKTLAYCKIIFSKCENFFNLEMY